MNYSITPSDNQKYILIKVQGEINRQISMKQNIEAHALGKKMGINRYFMDLTESRNTDSVLNNYTFAYTDMQNVEEINRFARVVALVSPDDNSHDFIETVLKNAGLNITLFTDKELALQHLLK